MGSTLDSFNGTKRVSHGFEVSMIFTSIVI